MVSPVSISGMTRPAAGVDLSLMSVVMDPHGTKASITHATFASRPDVGE
jgi:hypothetical protein